MLFDPAINHHYQPAYTMVGGGVLGSIEETKKKESTYVMRPMKSLIAKGVNLKQEGIKTIDSGNAALITEQGNRYTYDYLVVCPGISLRFDKIDGAREALDDPNSPVGSIYKLDYAYKTARLRENFKGGKAIFTLPVMPIKCGGAPQKIMYLSEETWRNNGIRDKCDI